MAKRLTDDEKLARRIEKSRRDEQRYQAKLEREKKKQKEIRHKEWLKREKERIKTKKAKWAERNCRDRKNVLYETSIKEFIEDTYLYVGGVPNTEKYKLYRFFFPYKMATPKGKLNPLPGFSESVALNFISILLNAGEMYGYDFIYDIFCRHRITGREFIRLYNNGVNSYKKLFPKAPAALLYALYNICSPGSTARGAGEYLMCLKISDVIKGKNGDICTKFGVNLEMKAFDGRLSCQKQSDVSAMDDNGYGYDDGTMLNDGMIELYKNLKTRHWTDQHIIQYFALRKIQTYKNFLTTVQRELFVKNMTENYDAFFINGEFTEESVNRINGCHDAYVYPLLEGFTHLKIDSNQPSSISKASDFNVYFRIFNRDDFGTPGLIIRMIEQGYIKFYGFIKNNGRDKAVHVGI